MKEIKEDKQSMFGAMFSSAQPFNQEINSWSYPVTYSLQNMTLKQLTIIEMFELEVLKDTTSNDFFIRLDSVKDGAIIDLINQLGKQSKEKELQKQLDKIPSFIKRWFK